MDRDIPDQAADQQEGPEDADPGAPACQPREVEIFTDLVPLCEAKGGDTPAVPNHLPPQSPFDFSRGTRPFPDEVEFGGGNGLRNLTAPGQVSDPGIFASRPERHAFGLPQGSLFSRWSVSFTGAVPGTYTYICEIHFGMEGTITVH